MTPAAVRAWRQVITLVEVDHRLSRLTWGEVGLAAEQPTPSDRSAARRRNRFAALRPEIAAGGTGLRRATRVRGLTYLLQTVRGLRARLAAGDGLTVIELTHVQRLLGGAPSALGDCLVAVARRLGRPSLVMVDLLIREEKTLGQALAIVRRVPDPVPRLTPTQIRRLSTRRLVRLYAGALHELRDTMLLRRPGAT